MRQNYALLGVDPEADIDTVKKAYRKLAKELHPDHNRGNHQAVERFTKVTDAYDAVCQFIERGGKLPSQPNIPPWAQKQPPSPPPSRPKEPPVLTVDVHFEMRMVYLGFNETSNGIHLSIPKGFMDGQTFDVTTPNKNKMRVRARIKDLDGYARKGRMLSTTVVGRRSELLRGKTIEIKNHPRPGGLSIITPKDIVDGETMVLKNGGLPGVNGTQGDLLVTFILLPEHHWLRRGMEWISGKIILVIFLLIVAEKLFS